MSEPPETDLDFYSRPENYTGGNLQAIQKFNFAKQKQEREAQSVEVIKKKKSGFDLFARYKHILRGYVDDEDEDDDEDEEDEITELRDDKDKKESEGQKEMDTTLKVVHIEPVPDRKEEEKVRKISDESRIDSPSLISDRKSDIISPLISDSPIMQDKSEFDVSIGTDDSKMSMSPTGKKHSLGSGASPSGRASVSARHARQNQISKELRRKRVWLYVVTFQCLY